MPRLSNEAVKRYIPLASDGCVFCGDPGKTQNVYHPKTLRTDEIGVHVKCCVACYGSYKGKNLEYRDFEFVKQVLSSRQRRTYGLDPNIRARASLGLTIYYGPDGEVACAEDFEGFRYDPKDVELYLKIKPWIIRSTKEQIEDFCKKNFTDQRFIIKVVSSFSK